MSDIKPTISMITLNVNETIQSEERNYQIGLKNKNAISSYPLFIGDIL